MGKKSKLITDMRDAEFEAAKRMIHCGFELETQSTLGHRWSDQGAVPPQTETVNSDANERAYSEGVENAIRAHERSLESIFSAWEPTTRPRWMTNCTPSEAVSALNHMKLPNLNALFTHGVITAEQMETIRNNIRRRALREVRREDFRPRGGRVGFTEYFHLYHGLNQSVQVGYDSSVRGFEFRTRGPRAYDQFIEESRTVFALQHEIDVACSFHIHLSVNGVAHRYSQRLQQAMMEYIIDHMDTLPNEVRERFQYAYQSTHFKTQLLLNKYTFVSYSSEHNTWEFRCFGNVSSVDSGKACLDMAITALQHAYKVITGKAKLASDSYALSQEHWSMAMYEAMNRGLNVSAAIQNLIDNGTIEEAA